LVEQGGLAGGLAVAVCCLLAACWFLWNRLASVQDNSAKQIQHLNDLRISELKLTLEVLGAYESVLKALEESMREHHDAGV